MIIPTAMSTMLPFTANSEIPSTLAHHSFMHEMASAVTMKNSRDKSMPAEDNKKTAFAALWAMQFA